MQSFLSTAKLEQSKGVKIPFREIDWAGVSVDFPGNFLRRKINISGNGGNHAYSAGDNHWIIMDASTYNALFRSRKCCPLLLDFTSVIHLKAINC